jgi:hypothetical protein
MGYTAPGPTNTVPAMGTGTYNRKSCGMVQTCNITHIRSLPFHNPISIISPIQPTILPKPRFLRPCESKRTRQLTWRALCMVIAKWGDRMWPVVANHLPLLCLLPPAFCYVTRPYLHPSVHFPRLSPHPWACTHVPSTGHSTVSTSL